MSFEQPTPIRQPLLPVVEPDVRGRTSRLPVPVSTLVGRQREIELTAGMIRDRRNRLITLTGAGGVGKTRLALASAAVAAGAFRDGADFVDLSSIRDPDFVIPYVAQSLGVRGFDDHTMVEALKETLRRRDLLLVLDNYEQVIEAAAPLASLLEACPQLTVVVTSRSALHLSGERIIPVQPLTLPDPNLNGEDIDAQILSGSEAVRLFADRTTAVRPEFTLTSENVGEVAAICARLDGLPLAIELAAARGSLISPREMLSHLEQRLPLLRGGARDLPARQQTMSDAIAWSYDLLTDLEKAMLRCLSVFAGGCGMDAVAAVCGPVVGRLDSETGPRRDDHLEVLEVIVSLIRQCLVQSTVGTGEPPGTRLMMLETVREFATQARLADGDIQAARRHSWFYRDLIAAAEPSFWGDEPVAGRMVHPADLGNIRAAMFWAMDNEETDTALQLAGAFLDPQWMFNYQWLASDDARRQYRWLQRALSLPGGTAEHRVKALICAACLGDAQDEGREAEQHLEEALNLSRASDDALGFATAAFFRGRSAYRQDHLDVARQWMTTAEEGFRTEGASGRMAWSLCFLASFNSRLAFDEGGSQADLVRARAYCEEALEIFQAVGHQPGIQRALHGLAYVAYKLRDFPVSMRLTAELLETASENGLPIYDYFDDLADIAGRIGMSEIAARLYGAAFAERGRHRSPLPLIFQAEAEADRAVARSALGAGRFQALWEEGTTLPLQRAVDEALAFALTGPRLHIALTPRERQILPLLATGMTAREIGAALFVSHRTVENHIANMRDKLGARTRAEIVDAARASGLIDPQSHAE